jgi:glycosyltransferase involved in cell wall biosynthesis
MSLSQPLISVMVPTYNHEKYIAEAITSVLAQTVGDFEVVVVDDGSTDRTGQIVRSFVDPRIRYLWQPNQGPAAASNTGLAACRGKYYAILAGDDVLHVERLSRQLKAYHKGPTRLLFSTVEFIDDDSRPLEPDFKPDSFKDGRVRRAQLLQRLFTTGEAVFGTTVFSERCVFLDGPPYDAALYQTHDRLRWVQLLKKYDAEILPEPLYKYRIRRGWENLSGSGTGKQIRARNELYIVMKSFFEGMSTELFRETFGTQLVNPNCTSQMELACEQALLFLHSSEPMNQLIGIEKMHQLLHDREAGEILKCDYGYDFARFAQELTKLNVTNQFPRSNSAVVVEEGDGWRDDNIVRVLVNPDVPHFSLRFDLERFTAPRTIAWVPFEEPRLGRVWIEWFRYRDGGGVLHDLGPDALSCHGCSRDGDGWSFDTVEPRLYFSPPGAVKQLEIAGRLELLSQGETCARLTTALAQKGATIERLTRQVEALGRQRSLWTRMHRRARRFFSLASSHPGR